MKKTVWLMVMIGMLWSQSAKAAEAPPAVSAQSAIVYHADEKRVLWEQAADRKMLIASTTKIMTALIALERCGLHEQVVITEQMANVEGSSMYLQKGKTYKMEELLYGLMLASGNDAATAIAIHVAGDLSAFAALMNEKAAELDMDDTCFENPHGLDSEKHYSTALDMAKLATYAMDHPTFAKIVGTRHITIQNLTYVNHNKLLWQCDGVIGLKTGYTKAAGRTLVSCCERNGQRLICVTLSAPDDWNDHKKLYEWAFADHRERVIMGKNHMFEIPLMTGGEEKIAVAPLNDVTSFLKDTEEAKCVVELPRFAFAPVSAGDHAGQVVVYVNGEKVREVPLVFMEEYKLDMEQPYKRKHGMLDLFG